MEGSEEIDMMVSTQAKKAAASRWEAAALNL
jgi:hypothetical protein